MKQEAKDFIAKYRDDISLFVKEIYGLQLDYQAEICLKEETKKEKKKIYIYDGVPKDVIILYRDNPNHIFMNEETLAIIKEKESDYLNRNFEIFFLAKRANKIKEGKAC